MDMTELARYFDHTALKAQTTRDEIIQLCREAAKHNFYSVCVNPCWLPLAEKELAGSSAIPITVVGFPLGANLTLSKVEETKAAIGAGAKEVDMVIAVGAMLSGEEQTVRKDIEGVVETCGKVPLKVIIETAYLTPQQIKDVTSWVVHAGAAFVKTSTGFAPTGAKVEDIKTMHQVISDMAALDRVGIKASGGIRDLAFTKELIAAGATRIGASASVDILREAARVSSSR